jgi:hypothetical protein
MAGLQRYFVHTKFLKCVQTNHAAITYDGENKYEICLIKNI